MRVKPLGKYVLVEEINVERVSPGGIVLADVMSMENAKLFRGKVIEVGAKAKGVKKDEIILFALGKRIEIGEYGKLLLVHQDDMRAVLEDEVVVCEEQ